MYFSILNLNSSNRHIYLPLLFLIFFINYMLIRKVKSIAEDIVETSQENINTLRGYQTLINKIESESFKSKKLVQLKALAV